jgi:taurine transport system substrate-binding protein
VPIGTAAHYGFLKQMEHFGVDVSTMEVVDMAPPDGAAAFAQGSLDMVCGWGGSLRRMKEHGNVLLTGAEKDRDRHLVFDVTSVPAGWVPRTPTGGQVPQGNGRHANAMWADDQSTRKCCR